MKSTGTKKLLTSRNGLSNYAYQQQRIATPRNDDALGDKTVIQEKKSQQNLINQIEVVKKIIDTFSSQLKSKAPAKSTPFKIQDCPRSLIDLEKYIHVLNAEIKVINQEIKVLKSFPEQIAKQVNKRTKSIKNLQLQKLCTQISAQKDQLLISQLEHQKKSEELSQARKIMAKTVQTLTKLTSNSKHLPTYEQFLQKQNQRKNQESRRLNRFPKKIFKSTKQLIQGEQEGKKYVLNSTNLKQAQSKKMIAESALKVLKKKHQAEVNQLNGKLDFLRDEDEQLDIKLKQKIEELKLAETKFSQTRQAQTKKLIKVARYSQPQL